MRKLLALFLCMCVALSQLNAQTRVITGKITDPNGRPVPGASIQVKGVRGGTVTDADGSFSITVPSTAKTITVSAVGFTEQSTSITGSTINLQLALGQNGLQEVVVVGYQTLRRAEVTGAVTTIGAKEISEKPTINVTQLIQGKSPGVQVTSSSGRPGINAFIRIRGTGSIGASSDPLILLDGVAINTAAYNAINPDEIEDITVLKDASATAIYGSRGSNGVLLITSKKGRGASTVSYSFRYGSVKEMPLQNLKLMNARQKLDYEYDFGPNNTNETADTMAAARAGLGQTIFTVSPAVRADIYNTMISRAADWDKELMQTGLIRTHEITLQGAAEKFRYYFSLNKSDNEGAEKVSFWNRIGGRLNTEYQANEWFKIGTNMGVSHTVENVNRELFNGQALYTTAQLINPWEPFYGSDGKMNLTTLGQNALETAIYNPNVADRIGSFATMYGEAKAFNHLTLKSQLGMNYNTLSQEYYLEPGSYLAAVLGYNQKRDNGNREFLYQFTNTANWKQTFASNHNINILAGMEFTKDKFYSYSLTSQGFPTASVNTLDNGSKPTQATTSRYDWSLISYFASVGYDYKQKYFLTLSGRRDGSSRFGKNNEFANFWAVGGKWDIKAEDFWKVKEISSLALRGSVGTSGNNNLGSGAAAQYLALGTYQLNVNYNAQPAASPYQIANPDLTWEFNNNYDLGLEYGLFDNRLKGSIDYYYRKTSHLLYPVNISLTTGFASYTGNIGSMKNSGVELMLGYDIIRKADLTWNITATYTHNDNKILSLYNDNVPAAGTGGYAYLKVGQPIFTYYLANWAGVNPQTGKNEYFKADGTTKSDVWDASMQKLQNGKSTQVKYYGSLNTSVTYKGFDLNAQFYYSGGNYVYNVAWQVGSSEGSNVANNQYTDVLDYWKKAGDVKRYANLHDVTQQTTYDSDKYLEKGDYIILRDLTLGYTLDSKIARRLRMKSLRVFVQGTNFWEHTKMHGIPEVGQSNGENTTYTAPGIITLYAYPQVRSFLGGVTVSF